MIVLFCYYSHVNCTKSVSNRVKSGNFGHQVNLEIDLVCFIFQFIGIKK